MKKRKKVDYYAYIEGGTRGMNSTPPDELIMRTTTVNLSAVAHCDKFICRECGICLMDWVGMRINEDGDDSIYEYEFKFCPECGAKIKDGDTDV